MLALFAGKQRVQLGVSPLPPPPLWYRSPPMPHTPRVLVVDDEPNLRKVLSATLKREGYDVATAPDGDAAIRELEDGGADVVVTDLVMPRRDGLSLLREVLKTWPEIPVIVITAHGTVDSAVAALKMGAFDYITKPFEQEELKRVIAKATKTRALGGAKVVADERGQAQMVGGSPSMKRALDVVDRVADSPSTVLITGESGTGKELVAHRIHDLSSRRNQPLIKINIAAIPKDLIESELFGFEKAPSPAPPRASRGASSWPTTAPCSWTRSGRCPSRSR